MYLDDLKVDISSEDFNMDEDSEIQIRDVLVCGEVTENKVEITEVTAEAYVINRDDHDFFLGELKLTDLIKNSKEYDHLKVRCEAVLQEYYDDWVANDGPAEARAESQYDAWREDQYD